MYRATLCMEKVEAEIIPRGRRIIVRALCGTQRNPDLDYTVRHWGHPSFSLRGLGHSHSSDPALRRLHQAACLTQRGLTIPIGGFTYSIAKLSQHENF